MVMRVCMPVPTDGAGERYRSKSNYAYQRLSRFGLLHHIRKQEVCVDCIHGEGDGNYVVAVDIRLRDSIWKNGCIDAVIAYALVVYLQSCATDRGKFVGLSL